MLKKLLIKANTMEPAQVMVIGFGVVILFGGLILNLPIAAKSGKSVGLLNALFTSTSAVCVTGLIVVDTSTYWNEFGQLVIISLIQIGGLGFMTMATMFSLLTGKKINLRERLLIQESLNQRDLSGLVKLTRYIIMMTFAIEGTGALLLSMVFIPKLGLIKGIWYSIFHSISAFCNAGFDLMGPISGEYSSLMYYVDNSLINLVICGLIILGGIGFPVLLDVINNKKYSKLNVHSKIVINTTAILIAIGFLFIFIVEFNNKGSLGGLNMKEKLLSSLFQSVTLRTAGYSTIDLTLLKESTLFLMIILMLIGASPASTGGGLKTTTVATLFLTVKSFILGKEDIEVYQRRISSTTVRKSLGIFFIGVFVALFGTLMLTIVSPGFSLLESAFEVVSAFATVGLSLGGSPTLTAFGKIIIMILMFSGRVGSLTIFIALLSRSKKIKSKVRYAEGKIIVG
ncbi:MAG: TrkH family potassium uptake protein [Terrisporobacter othiniensis]|uniref:TrkH family potassium uptake protein n=2 Tax=Terrisporobacter hibernicus TaxID=2813371 RepID=A0AAX2ZLC1_9FIRM|nr:MULTISPECIES: TrkH family potassium uptake protein [Terrisporobacter]MDU4861916.1 TrkH family potassium uptake protein [Terrisporobacter othiniensis]MDU6995787.1 TrkH family potassium uptake protein [Terrisporobacter othiniensis]UEL49786.1 TrkH family potassium uptake protein [Terrisporobacter hibernicus]